MTQSLSLLILTFNCAKALLDVNTLISHLFSPPRTSSAPDLIVLSLQEIAPTPYVFLGGPFLSPYINQFHDGFAAYPNFDNFGKNASNYLPVVTHNTGSTCLIVYTNKPHAIKDIETSGVGTGFWDMGIKGAAGVRLKYDDVELTFAALHLAAMEWKLKRRNQDWKTIVESLVFSPSITNKIGDNIPLLSSINQSASIYKATSHLFVAGDLNYRTSDKPPAPQDHLTAFPQPDMPLSDEHHYLNLLKSDQLNQARRAGQTCHGLSEANITFPPTFKYNKKPLIPSNKNETEIWNWAPHRWPSWCDRILYMDSPSWFTDKFPDAQIKTLSYNSLPLLDSSDHQPVALALEVPLIQIPEPNEEEDSDDPRINPPFAIKIGAKNQRIRIRRLEYSAGVVLWLTTTIEGGCIFAVFLVGLVSVYLYLKLKAR